MSCKNMGHCFSKREEAGLPLLFLGNSCPVFCNLLFATHKVSFVLKGEIDADSLRYGLWCCVSKVHIYSEKGTKFCEIFPLLLTTVHTQSRVRGRFRKMLWPSQNIWTLPWVSTNFWWSLMMKFMSVSCHQMMKFSLNFEYFGVCVFKQFLWN